MARGRFARAYEFYQQIAVDADKIVSDGESAGHLEPRSVQRAKSDRALAKLGLSICLESQGQLEAALVELEGAEIPEEIRRERLDRVSERSNSRSLR